MNNVRWTFTRDVDGGAWLRVAVLDVAAPTVLAAWEATRARWGAKAPMHEGLPVCCPREGAGRVADEMRAAMIVGTSAAGFRARFKVGVGETWAEPKKAAEKDQIIPRRARDGGNPVRYSREEART